MKPVHFRKLSAVMEMKSRVLFDKNYIVMPLFTIGFVLLMRFLSARYSDGGMVSASSVATGVIMNICMCSICSVAVGLAEEKEKHTLRVLMTSSVNGMEFFIGSIIPVFAEAVLINALIPLLCGFSMNGFQWGMYLLFSSLSSLIGTIVGMLIGIYAKDQMAASMLATPFLTVLLIIPMIADTHPVLEAISSYSFTGVMTDFANQLTTNGNVFQTKNLVILIAEILIAAGVFLILYKKNGFEAN